MPPSKMMQVRVHPGLYRLAQQAAGEQFCDLSDYVRQALRERLERDGYRLSTYAGGAEGAVIQASDKFVA
ncbi:MAG: hypothetical protein GC191_10320 [Azospirillum sp.]|nr:hypothetical protein [Azospirillum sp.]